MTPSEDYGLWASVAISSLVFIVFAFSFTRPRTRQDWKSFGAFSAFVVALFTEMYGFPLTLYLMSGWLGSRYQGIDLLSHNAGHLWTTLLGWKGDPHFNAFHILSDVLIIAGLVFIGKSWKILYRAQRASVLATTGPYAYVRHPQYLGFVVVMSGFLLQWPTLLTLAMFPMLVWRYVRLAYREESEVRANYGGEYDIYAAATPGFLPRLKRRNPDNVALRRSCIASVNGDKHGNSTNADENLREVI